MACRNTTRTQLIQCYSLVLRSRNEVEWRLFEKLTTKSIKIEGKFMHGKVKMWKKHIKTNFHGQDIPYDMYCNATALLKIDFVYKQSKNYHPQVYDEQCKYTDTESQQCSKLSCSDDERYFNV